MDHLLSIFELKLGFRPDFQILATDTYVWLRARWYLFSIVLPVQVHGPFCHTVLLHYKYLNPEAGKTIIRECIETDESCHSNVSQLVFYHRGGIVISREFLCKKENGEFYWVYGQEKEENKQKN